MAGERVLVIDDSSTITKVVQLVLSKAGFIVDTAGDGEAGLTAARTARPAMILLDYMMPKMNGDQFCRALSADAELRDIPVVLMSAKGDHADRLVQMMGIADYIMKPFSPEAITAVVRQTLHNHGAAAPREETASRSTKMSRAEIAAEDPDLARADSTALARLRVAIVTAIAASAGEPALAATVTDVARDALDDATLTRLLAAMDSTRRASISKPFPKPTPESPPDLRGDLRVAPLADLLQLLQHQTGVLALARGELRLDIYLRAGRIDQAIGHGVADALGSRELLDDSLRWRDGQFQFTAGAAAPATATATATAIDLDIAALLLTLASLDSKPR